MGNTYFIKSKHWESFTISAKVDGQLTAKILMDRGSTSNLMSYKFFKKSGKDDDEIIPSGVVLSDFAVGI